MQQTVQQTVEQTVQEAMVQYEEDEEEISNEEEQMSQKTDDAVTTEAPEENVVSRQALELLQPGGGGAETSADNIMANITSALVKVDHGPEMNKPVADFVNDLLEKGEPETKLSGLEKQYLTPGNCQNLGAVRVNPEIWSVLPPGAQHADKYMQLRQLRLSKALTALAVAMDGVRTAASLVPILNTVFSQLTDVFSLVNAVHRAENQERREKIRPSLNMNYRHLCSPTVPVTTQFFGDKLEELVKQQSDVNKIKHQVAGTNKLYSGQRGGRAPRGRVEKPWPVVRNTRGGFQGSQHGGFQGSQRGGFQGSQRGRGQGRGRGRGRGLYKVISTQAGRLRFFVDEWCKLTTDPYVLDLVQHAHLKFCEGFEPKQLKNVQPYQMTQEVIIVDNELEKLIQKGVITRVREEREVYLSNIFLRPKKNGTFRLILNLKGLNEEIEYQKFKMETLESIVKLVRPNCFMASLDLSDAYYTVPVAPEHQKKCVFLRLISMVCGAFMHTPVYQMCSHQHHETSLNYLRLHLHTYGC